MANWANWMPCIYTICQVRGLEPYFLGIIPSPVLDTMTVATATVMATVQPPASIETTESKKSPMSTPTTPSSTQTPPFSTSLITPYGALTVVPPLFAFFPISLPTTACGPTTYAASGREWHECDTLAQAHIILNVANIPGSGLDISGMAASAW